MEASKLKTLLAEAYEAGYHGSLEMKESYVANAVDSQKEDDWKVYTIEELKKMPVRTVIKHQTLGYGLILEQPALHVVHYDHYVHFKSKPESKYMFLHNGSPWDKPIRIVGQLEKDYQSFDDFLSHLSY